MSFKVHLLIISAIIIVVFFAWRASQNAPEAVQAAPANTSIYSIIIVHAHWGLNCKDRTPNPVYLQEDNVKQEVSDYCNGKMECKIPVNATTFKVDPSPQCPDKQLEVDYRCFTYDRLWSTESTFGTLNIKCQEPPPVPAPAQ